MCQLHEKLRKKQDSFLIIQDEKENIFTDLRYFFSWGLNISNYNLPLKFECSGDPNTRNHQKHLITGFLCVQYANSNHAKYCKPFEDWTGIQIIVLKPFGNRLHPTTFCCCMLLYVNKQGHKCKGTFID